MEEELLDPNAVALAKELRAVATALADLEIAPEHVARALPFARSLRECLEGPRRERWYEMEPGTDFYSLGARRAYQGHSPLRGAASPIAPPMSVERVEGPDGLRMVGRATLSAAYEGPPHGVHGGIVAALFDEILGATMALAPPPGVTGKLEVRYRHVTPLDEELRFEAWVESSKDRRVVIHATCHAGETLTADARGLFVRVDFGEVQQHMAARRGA
jgi:acyl-coenzyme A thioesterase PaaI-like protein